MDNILMDVEIIAGIEPTIGFQECILNLEGKKMCR
jgi:hypothetical protein